MTLAVHAFDADLRAAFFLVALVLCAVALFLVLLGAKPKLTLVVVALLFVAIPLAWDSAAAAGW